jgi:erythrocyte band 7 integral membrane protein
MVLDVVKALKERTIGTLRLVLGSQTVQQLIENRDALARDIEEIISPVAESWGIHVEAMLLKDLMFSKDLLDSLSSAAKQKRFAEAKIISAQAEVDAAKLMRAASDILNSAPAMQIRYLDTMVNMSRESGRNVIFMPGELAQSLSKKK